MPRKCSVFGCNSGFAKDTSKTPVYRFPKDPVQRMKWILPVPNLENKLEAVTNHMGICRLHWPDDEPMILKHGSAGSPTNPPSVFSKDIPSSLLLQTPHKSRTSKNSTTDVRDRAGDIDQLPAFDREDLFSLSCSEIWENNVLVSKCPHPKEKFMNNIEQYMSGHGIFGHTLAMSTLIVLLSTSKIGSIHRYSIYFTPLEVGGIIQSLQFEAFRGIKKIVIPLFDRKNVIKRWSQLDALMQVVTSPLEGMLINFSFHLPDFLFFNMCTIETRIHEHARILFPLHFPPCSSLIRVCLLIKMLEIQNHQIVYNRINDGKHRRNTVSTIHLKSKFQTCHIPASLPSKTYFSPGKKKSRERQTGSYPRV